MSLDTKTPAPARGQAQGSSQASDSQHHTASNASHIYLNHKEIELGDLKAACSASITIEQDRIMRNGADGEQIAPWHGPMVWRELKHADGVHAGYERILSERIRKSPDDKLNDKFATSGTTVSGCFTPIGFSTDQLLHLEGTLVICAGLAEGYSIHLATGLPVACTVGENNIASVVKVLRSVAGHAKLLVAVDNDKAGHRAGKASDNCWVCPAELKDWSDVRQRQGLQAVREQLQKIRERQVRKDNHPNGPDNAPLPLPERQPAPPFPVEALGPVLGPAAKRLAYYVQAPLGMACQSVLATAALAVQGLIDVQRGIIGTGPTSLFFLTVAQSGDRKSSEDKIALAPVRKLEAELRESMRENAIKYRAERQAWEMRRESVTASYKSKKGVSMTRDEQVELQEKLAEVDRDEPRPPPMPNLTFSEPTAEGLYRHLEHNHPSAGLFSDEGIGFFDGHGMSDDSRGRTIERMAKLWDGDALPRTRSKEFGLLAGRRLSAHLMMQPVVADKVFADPLLQGQGFLPRFLICQEPSLMGTRFLEGRDPSVSAEGDPEIKAYHRRIDKLIREPLSTNDNGELQPAVSVIEGEAFTVWCMLHDGIEKELASNGDYYDVRAYASKAAENAARLAAIMAKVEGQEHPQVEHIERAGKLISYYLESMKIRTEETQHDPQELLARDLLDWLRDNGGILEAKDFKKLPRKYRSAKQVRPLLKLLTDGGHLNVSSYSSRHQPMTWEVVEQGNA